MQAANVVIVHGFAHRLMQNGSIESTPVVTSETGNYISDSDWQVRGGNSMDHTGADLSEIFSQLQRLNAIFYDNNVRVPTSEPLVPQ